MLRRDHYGNADLRNQVEILSKMVTQASRKFYRAEVELQGLLVRIDGAKALGV